MFIATRLCVNFMERAPVHVGRMRRVLCDVCGANSTVDDESLADVVSRTSAHLSTLMPKFFDLVSLLKR